MQNKMIWVFSPKVAQAAKAEGFMKSISNVYVVKPWNVDNLMEKIIVAIQEQSGGQDADSIRSWIADPDTLIIIAYYETEDIDTTELQTQIADYLEEKGIDGGELIMKMQFEPIPMGVPVTQNLSFYTLELGDDTVEIDLGVFQEIAAEDEVAKQNIETLKKLVKSTQKKKESQQEVEDKTDEEKPAKKVRKLTSKKPSIYLLPQRSSLQGIDFMYDTKFISDIQYDQLIQQLSRQGHTHAIIIPYDKGFIVFTPVPESRPLVKRNKITTPIAYLLAKKESGIKGYIVVEKSFTSANQFDVTVIGKLGEHIIYFRQFYGRNQREILAGLSDILEHIPTSNFEIVVMNRHMKNAVISELLSPTTLIPSVLKDPNIVKIFKQFPNVEVVRSGTMSNEAVFMVDNAPIFKKVDAFSIETILFSDKVFNMVINTLKTAIAVVLVANILAGYNVVANEMTAIFDKKISQYTSLSKKLDKNVVLKNISDMKQYIESMYKDTNTVLVLERIFQIFPVDAVKEISYNPQKKEVKITLDTTSNTTFNYLYTLMQSGFADKITPPTTSQVGQNAVAISFKIKDQGGNQ